MDDEFAVEAAKESELGRVLIIRNGEKIFIRFYYEISELPDKYFFDFTACAV